MRFSDKGAALIQEFEGFSAKPYLDTNGVWTIGYGTQHGVTKDSKPITSVQAHEILRDECDERFGPVINKLKLPLTQSQFDALVCISYNVGPGILDSDTTLGYLLRKREWIRAADAFLLYDKAEWKGEMTRLGGLTRRRTAERKMFLNARSPYTVQESAWMREYDILVENKIELSRRRVLQERMTAQRKRIWRKAQVFGWNREGRHRRYHSLLSRTKGQ
jgi:lysozyme